MNNIDNYNTIFKSDCNSSDENCSAFITNDGFNEITPENTHVKIGSVQTVMLVDSCSIETQVHADTAIGNRKDANRIKSRKVKTFSNEPVKALGTRIDPIERNIWSTDNA